jgi:serine/threonine protein kinase
MSVVWRGYDKLLGRQVAIKVLSPDLAGDQCFRDRIRHEVDFGISAVAGVREAKAPVLGTPAYLAAERLNGTPAVPATDVYALRVLLYRAENGTPQGFTLNGVTCTAAA